MIITTEQIMSWNPCDRYNESIVSGLIGDGKTPIEITELEIPIEDRLWVLLRPDIIPEMALHSIACDFAQEVAHLNTDPRVQTAFDAKRKWIAGQISDKELEAAREAAMEAAGAAACEKQLNIVKIYLKSLEETK